MEHGDRKATLQFARVLALIMPVLMSALPEPRASCSASEQIPEAPEKRIMKALEIRPPCSLLWVDSYLDGGSIGGFLVGSAGDTLRFSWDGRMRDVSDSLLISEPRLAYIGAEHPSKPDAIPLQVGSVAESTFVDLLQSCVDVIIAPIDQKRMHDACFDYTVTWEERLKRLPPLVPDLKHALYAVRIIFRLETQRSEHRTARD